MKTRLLDATEFKATFAEPMRDVFESATNVLDICPYVAAIPEDELGGHTIIDGRVDYVYRSADSRFDPVLIATRQKTSSS